MSQHAAGAVVTVDELEISPPPGSVPTTSLRLTLFDITWTICHPIQRVFLYDYPHSDSHFRQTTVPNLAHSLSLTLRHFYPLAARLVAPTRPDERPHILYSDGDSVPLTVAQTTLDFDRVISDRPNDVELLHPLLPKLPPPGGETSSAPLLAVKVTLFPNRGICIGFEFSHVAADGLAFSHFVKSWASIAKSGGRDLSWVENFPPCHDRALIGENRELENSLFEIARSYDSSHWGEDSRRRMLAGKVRATFCIDGEHISRMKASLSNRINDDGKQLPPASTFTVASAFIWTSLTKSRETEFVTGGDEDKIDCYPILVDCRGRLNPKLPATYFGNCLSGVQVLVKRTELIGGDGFATAAKAITAKIEGIEAEGPLRKFFTLPEWQRNLKLGRVMSVAGSPKLRVYETDFGWGRPRKSEPVHVDFSGSVYLSDGRDEEKGGVEFGLTLSETEMGSFVAAFDQQLKRFSR